MLCLNYVLMDAMLRIIVRIEVSFSKHSPFLGGRGGWVGSWWF